MWGEQRLSPHPPAPTVTDPTPAKLDLDALLRSGVSAARAGNRSAARKLFLAITRAYPHELRAWLGLAGVAESIEEQRVALERVLTLDPDHPKAGQALAQLPPPPPEHTSPAPAAPMISPAAPTPPPELTPAALAPAPQAELPRGDQRPFPLLNLIALGIIGLLIVAIVAVLNAAPGTGQPSAGTLALPSPVLQAVPTNPTSAAPDLGSAPAPEPTVLPIRPNQTGAPIPAPTPRGPTPAVGMPAQPSLPLGTLIEVDGWSTTLLQPDYALILDGSIGDLRPSGHFVLALMAISNNSPQQRRIPADLFTLVDNRGRRYQPTPNASSAYLTLYGRGQHGDLALEDSLSPQSGMRSVPVLFDVPLDAVGLVLTIHEGGSAGWLIERSVATPVNVGP